MNKLKYVMIDGDNTKKNDYKIYELDVSKEDKIKDIKQKLYDIQRKNTKFCFFRGYLNFKNKELESVDYHPFFNYSGIDKNTTIIDILIIIPDFFDKIYVYYKQNLQAVIPCSFLSRGSNRNMFCSIEPNRQWYSDSKVVKKKCLISNAYMQSYSWDSDSD